MQKISRQNESLLSKLKFFPILLVMLFSFMLSSAFAEDSPETAVSSSAPVNLIHVRVGFYRSPNFSDVDKNGNRVGYTYEYLQRLRLFSPLEYEYIGMGQDWPDMLQMLENGQIDIMTEVVKTPEREKIFDFSDIPMGESATRLIISRNAKSKFSSGDYKTYSGMRIGAKESSYQIQALEEFAKEKNFTYQLITYPNQAKMDRDLAFGILDGVVQSETRSLNSSEIILDRFDPVPYYIVVKKGNTALLKEINFAMRQLDNIYPNYIGILYQKFFGISNTESYPLSTSEENFIRESNAQNHVFQAILNPDIFPYSGFINGKPSGILADISQEICRRTGLKIQIVQPASRQEYWEDIYSAAYPIVLEMHLDNNQAEKYGYSLTDKYYTLRLARLTRKNFKGDPTSAAVQEPSYIKDIMISQFFQGRMKCISCASEKECIQDVLLGKVDETILYDRSAQLAAYNDETNTLTAVTMPLYETEIGIGIRSGEDPRLGAVFEKVIASLNENELIKIASPYTDLPERPQTIRSFIYSNPLLALGILAILASTIILIIRLIATHRQQALEAIRLREFERFISYVNSSNVNIHEINLKDKYKISYHLESGNVKKEISSFSNSTDGWHDQVHPDDMDAIADKISPSALQNLIKGKPTNTDSFECRTQQPDGSWCWFSITLLGIRPDDEHPQNFLIFKQNIEKTKRIEEEKNQALTEAMNSARQANSAKTFFLSRMSHEIRTPLNAVIGFITLIKEELTRTEPDKESISSYLQKADGAGHHLLAIINDVLDISSIESGKIELAHEIFNIKDLLESLDDTFRSQAETKGIHFDILCEQPIEENIIGDKLRLNQIFMNLLSNAIKFTPADGTVTLTISQTSRRKDSVFIRAVCRDTGIGMKKEFLPHLFEPFMQQDPTISQRFGGTGLGMSITRSIVEIMQGSITVNSEEGKGSVFTVDLPFEYVNSPDAGTSSVDFSGLQALIVDDEKSSADYIRMILERMNIRVKTVSSGEDAINAIKIAQKSQTPFDFYILDQSMPGENGLQIVQRIQRRLTAPPAAILLIPANNEEQARSDAGDTDIKGFIHKPATQSSVCDLLTNLYGEKRTNSSVKASTKKNDIPDFHGEHILLAEDNSLNMEIACKILTYMNLAVDKAENGQEALQKFETQPQGTYSLIFLDIQMPVMDGYAAAQAIRASSHPDAKTIPILAMTANAFREDISKSLAAGMNGHISKPIDVAELKKVLSQYLK